ncbi:oxidoreductase [Streptomonospora alba]|uniref:Oxidoreductase n=1 Tax=Streptomonospora alba TaxID=183763 RepID=A0A0C2JJ28_9ACTN|nr:PhzF family phenazine biosynthesis protein [Streptomonospora alba]KIH96907.1 oxidoreductase [Streptomonospora alba]
MPPFHIVDAFTDTPFAGNPAVVVPLDGDYGDGWAQAVATEFNQPATAFLRPLTGDGDADYELRWFSPRQELALCGHGTLAAAHILTQTGAAGPLRFRTGAGMLTVETGDGRLWLDLPANPPFAAAPPEGVLAAIGAQPAWTGRTGLGDVLLAYDTAAEVQALRPDLESLARAMIGLRGVIVTAPAEDGDEHAFVSRFFAPTVGNPEDHVTGSAHTALGPYWAQRLDRTTMLARQCSPRGGTLAIELPQEPPDRVRIGGPALTVASGQLHT